MMKKQSGFTLIELMVSLALGIAISWLVLDVSLNAIRSNQDTVANGEVIDKGVFLVDLLKREINYAGYYGEVKPDNVNIWTKAGDGGLQGTSNRHAVDYCTETPDKFHLTTPIFVLNNPSTVCSFLPTLNPLSDVLMIRRASTHIGGSLTPKQHYVQSNFWTARIATGNQNVFTLKAMNGFDLAPIREFSQAIYYLDSNKNFERARLIAGKVVLERLMEGVEDFQVEYGRDTNSDHIVDTFESITNDDDWYSWQNVKTVEVSLLISGGSVSQPETRKYQYADRARFTRTDNQKRRLFSFVAAVRH